MRFRLRTRKGFTLAEVLIVLAIMALLVTLAVPAVLSYSRSLKLTSLDDAAHTVFMTAQSKLMSMKNAGEDLSKLSSVQVDEHAEEGVAAGKYYAVGADGKEGLNALVPFGSVSPDVAEANYVVEIDPQTGGVYAVWYWEKGKSFNYLAEAYSKDGALPDRNARLKNNVMVGYYGGSQIDRPEIKQTPLPKVTVVNAEELLLEISVPRQGIEFTKPFVATVTLTDEHGRHEIVSNALLQYDADKGADTGTLVLDTLKSYDNETSPVLSFDKKVGRSFQKWLGADGKPAVSPGENFDIEVKVAVQSNDYLPQYVYKSKVNGLFASADGERAEIAYGRHLRNLDPAVSGLTALITKAVQTRKIDFETSTADPVYSWKDTYGTSIAPLPMTNLSSFDGGKFGIAHATISGSGDVGLFESFSGELKDIWLSDTVVLDASENVGALAGSASNVTVSGCRVWLTAQSGGAVGTEPRLQGENVGGLFGTTAGSVSISGSFASTVESGNVVGGLVGYGSASVVNSYAAGYLSGTTVGGLFGRLGTAASTLQNSYAAGIIGAARTAGGLVAEGSPTSDGCYSAVRYSADVVTSSGSTVTVHGTFEEDSSTEYVSQMGMTYSQTEGVPVTAFEMYVTGGYKDGAPDTTQSITSSYQLLPETQNEYGLSKGYPYQMAKADGVTLPHYGDWLEESEAYLVYYEQYADKTYGLYAEHDRFSVNTLKAATGESDLDKRDYVIDDGYALFILSAPDTTGPLSLDVTVGGEAQTLEARHFEHTSFRGLDANCLMYLLKEPTLSIPADWSGYTSGGGLLTQPIDRYYTTLTYQIRYQSETGDGQSYGQSYANPYSEKTYYFNPHFACEVFEKMPQGYGTQNVVYSAKRGAEGEGVLSTETYEGKIVIRSARQLSNVHCYTNNNDKSGLAGIGGVKSAHFCQLLDIDFALYSDSKLLSGGGEGGDRLVAALLYKGSYDGNRNVIRNIFLSRTPVSDVNGNGLFAKVGESDLQGIYIVNPTGFAGGEKDFHYMGGLVGHISGGSVVDCGIYTENKEMADSYITKAPYYRHYAVNSNASNVVVGGLIGYAANCRIEDSFAAVKIFGITSGGLIGHIASGCTVKDCYSAGYTKYSDYYFKETGEKSCDALKGYPAYSEESGTDSINVSGARNTGTAQGYGGGFAGIIEANVRFEGICYTTCSIRGDIAGNTGLFAGSTPTNFADSVKNSGATLFSTGVAISGTAGATTIPYNGHNYTFYSEGKVRSEPYLTSSTAFGSLPHKVETVFPYNNILTAFPYPSNLSAHYGDWA